jgi:AbrB family looped-hinge helix DNA binding protein
MLITIDKRGSINLPLSIRKDLGLTQGSSLDLTINDGGTITLHPVAIYRTVRLNETGLAKINEARTGSTGELPDWLKQEMDHAATDSDE